MANAKVIYNTLVSKLNLPESAEEISALAFAILQHLGISRTDVLASREAKIELDKFDDVIHRLNQHEPLQYIFNEAWFYGRKFFVDNRVLIPRAETEILVETACQIAKWKEHPIILDIGTGSGCIAISLALEMQKANVLGIDVSPDALEVAKKNTHELKANVQLAQCDILNEQTFGQKFDLIVSNPPYISLDEKSFIPKNVHDFEPHGALFSPSDDALLFYRTLTKTAIHSLTPEGAIIVEINEQFGQEVAIIFGEGGLQNIKIAKDLRGKDRIVVATISDKA